MIKTGYDLYEALAQMLEDGEDIGDMDIVIETDEGDAYEEGVELDIQTVSSYGEKNRKIINILTLTS